MTEAIRTLVAIDEGVTRTSVEAALPYDSMFHLVGILEGLHESWATLEETSTDVLVVASAGSDRALFFIDNAVKQSPDRPVVVLMDGSPNGFVRRAFEAGADDLVVLPATPDAVRFAVEKVLARRAAPGGSSAVATAPMVIVLGPKGGTGKTLTCANLAVGLADLGKRVALVDLDLQFGDLGLALGIRPERTIWDLARSGGSLDATKLDAYLSTHSSGARVLMAPTRPDQAGAVSISLLRDVYATLRTAYDIIVVDTPPGFTPEVIAAIDASTHACMVGTLDSLSLKNTKLGLETLELMGYGRERILLVLNRADTKVGITPEDVHTIVGRQPEVLVPSDRDIPRAVNEGTPIIRSRNRSHAAAAFRALAEKYAQATERVEATDGAEAPSPPPRGLLASVGWRR
jgi:pilus assembly protein CpaE